LKKVCKRSRSIVFDLARIDKEALNGL
jgi:hypothetical protein